MPDDPMSTQAVPPATGDAPPTAAVTPTAPQPLGKPLAAMPAQPLAPPGFEILGELGRGGMGVVYHARQTGLNREVALKMILAGGHSSVEDRTRFLAEAEAIAALNHPGIVQVYEFGTHAGQPWFALEYCPGGSLAKRLDGTPLPARDATSLLQKIAYAVQAAHEKGIVHRDLKPANVLMSKTLTAEDAENAEKAADAGLSSAYSAISAVKVTDFGLAKRVESGHDLTKTGAVMGTPSYMAPEQALGDGKRIGPATDVYALGAILYELLTGRPPFRADNPFDTMLQVVNEDPVSIRQLQKKVPTDLETICHKALHKEPGRRYGNAKDLARDLGRWLGGEPTKARPARVWERAAMWCYRNPSPAAWLSALPAFLLAGPTEGLVIGCSAAAMTVPLRWSIWIALLAGLAGAGLAVAACATLPVGPDTLTAFAPLSWLGLGFLLPPEEWTIPVCAGALLGALAAVTAQSFLPQFRKITPVLRLTAIFAALAIPASEIVVVYFAPQARKAEYEWRQWIRRQGYRETHPGSYSEPLWGQTGPRLYSLVAEKLETVDGFLWRIVPGVSAGLVCGRIASRRAKANGAAANGLMVRVMVGLVAGALAASLLIQIAEELSVIGQLREDLRRNDYIYYNQMGWHKGFRFPYPFGMILKGFAAGFGGLASGYLALFSPLRRG